MQELLVVEVIPREKGRTSIRFDNGMEVLLYKGEVRKLSLREGTVISREKYDEIIYEILGTRAKNGPDGTSAAGEADAERVS